MFDSPNSLIMKLSKVSIYIIIVILFASCRNTYYQIYKTEVENGQIEKDKIVFEDKNCSVYYFLWSSGGNIGFSVFNKTENDLVIDLKRTFFVINGVAYQYFQSRSFSNFAGNSYSSYYSFRGATLSGKNITNGSEITTFEKQEIIIPPKTRVTINEYRLVNSRFPSCDLARFPTKKSKNNTLKFEKSNSPFVFSNLISYTIKNDTSRIENRFYVKEITNYKENQVFTTKELNKCGVKYEIPLKVYKDSLPERFYIRYEGK